MQMTKNGDAVDVRRAGFPVDIVTGPAPLGYESAGELACGSLECNQGRGEVCYSGCIIEESSDFADLLNEANEEEARQLEPWAWLTAGVFIAAIVAALYRVFA